MEWEYMFKYLRLEKKFKSKNTYDKKGEVGIMFFYITLVVIAIVVIIVLLATSNKILDGLLAVGKRIASALVSSLT